jgi:hypothetical protein
MVFLLVFVDRVIGNLRVHFGKLFGLTLGIMLRLLMMMSMLTARGGLLLRFAAEERA